MPKQPLGEVFGFPIDNQSPEAARYRQMRLCPFNNRVPNCTKDKAQNPLGVCSVWEGSNLAITCPVRFREHWIIAEDAAAFFFSKSTKWTSLTEVKLADRNGKSAGNIDVVLVSYDEKGRLLDFGACEVQAVYISGNIRSAFEHYMESPIERTKMDWSGQLNYPRPDYLSSSRKRLAPQLLFKGGILSGWKKKQAVALNRKFFETLPKLKTVSARKAEIAWLIYDLMHDKTNNVFKLERQETVYTEFQPALFQITTPEPGRVEDFIQHLQEKLDQKLESIPPDTTTPSLDLT